MKIISVDNFNRDYIDDYLVCENVNENYGKLLVDLLRGQDTDPNSSRYYRLVEDDYKLQKFDV